MQERVEDTAPHAARRELLACSALGELFLEHGKLRLGLLKAAGDDEDVHTHDE